MEAISSASPRRSTASTPSSGKVASAYTYSEVTPSKEALNALHSILPFNQFTWSSRYQVFGSVAFKSGALVQATTNVQNIASGLC